MEKIGDPVLLTGDVGTVTGPANGKNLPVYCDAADGTRMLIVGASAEVRDGVARMTMIPGAPCFPVSRPTVEAISATGILRLQRLP